MSHCFPLAPFWSQRCELFRADNLRLNEQFQAIGALTRCLQQLAPYLADLTICVAVTQRAPFFNLAQRIAAFRDELIRSSPDSLTATSRLLRPCRFSPVAPFSFAPRAKGFSIIRADCFNNIQIVPGNRSWLCWPGRRCSERSYIGAISSGTNSMAIVANQRSSS